MSEIKLWRLGVKTLVMVLIFNFLLTPVLVEPLGRLSIYNRLVPGRRRFPYGENPAQSYSLNTFDLEANLHSHQVAAISSEEQTFNVFIYGDSSTWGTLLKPGETLAGQLNALSLSTGDERPVRVYNLGYPTMSLAKDLLFMEKTLSLEPDLILWLVTLESFPLDKQLDSPLVANNPELMGRIIKAYGLPLDVEDDQFVSQDYWGQTLLEQRRHLANLYRLQLYGVMWGITGIDQYYPEEYERAQRDLEDVSTFKGWQEGDMTGEDLAYPLLEAGLEMAGEIPVLLINEPILVSTGANSDLRYNFYYPRWAYDQYRAGLQEISQENGWHYRDYWNLVPENEFTNTAVHLTPQGVGMLREQVTRDIIQILDSHFSGSN